MGSPFRSAVDLLSGYAQYHRDRRNIVTHLIGVPMNVFAVGVLLSRPGFTVGSWGLSPAWLLFGLVAAWYLTRGEFLLGLAASACVALLLLAHQVSGGGVGPWLGWGLGFFLVGWALQFAGHYYEGRRPALADDSVGLLVGPLFVVMELLGLLGLFKALISEIESHVGPTTLRNLAHPA